MVILEEMLYERYEECDSQGHLKPNQETNFCNYCYRNLTGETVNNIEFGLKRLAEELLIKWDVIGWFLENKRPNSHA